MAAAGTGNYRENEAHKVRFPQRFRRRAALRAHRARPGPASQHSFIRRTRITSTRVPGDFPAGAHHAAFPALAVRPHGRILATAMAEGVYAAAGFRGPGRILEYVPSIGG